MKYYYVYYLVLFPLSVSSIYKASLPFLSFQYLLFLYLMYTIATDRLTLLTSTIMGEIPQQQEHILCLLPFPEDAKILDRLRQKYNVEITYKQIFFGVGKALDLAAVPDGELNALSFPFHFPKFWVSGFSNNIISPLRNLASCNHTRYPLILPSFRRESEESQTHSSFQRWHR